VASIQRRSVRYSQNFLKDRDLVERLLDQAEISPDDLVVEIGPGTGVITAGLARRSRQVVAIEKDPDLAGALARRLANVPNVMIRRGDILQTELPDPPFKVFANIPFNITAAIVSKLVAGPCLPDDAYLIVQKEAAERFSGRPLETLSAVLLKPWFEPAIVQRLRPDDFAPAPAVDVVMLRLRKRGPPLVGVREAQLFRDFVVYAYMNARPTLLRGLRTFLEPEEVQRLARTAGVGLRTTPGLVPFEHWLVLFHEFRAVAGGRARRAVGGSEERLRRQQEGLQKRHRTSCAG
jgi:23S rRNA (adenine-N6)-dimethyltransferase